MLKCRNGNPLVEGATVVVITPQTARQAVQGKVVAVSDCLNLPPNAPPMKQIAISIVFNFMIPANATQLTEMWVVKEPEAIKIAEP